ncbi:MAG: xanthine dehydrogenase family protein molybdopterin-binding subunit, partial [Proteobacteria bacterium]|nr:xanthine dehydrogenase family protein molybdopterin-binding subunit [Pseudomonadota bacterium]
QARFRATTTPLDECSQGDAYWPYGFGAQGVEVTVDTMSGKVTVDKVIVAQDVGRAVNPKLVEGQIRGAVAMGIGFALFEEYRVEEGFPLDNNFDTYRLPTCTDMPPCEVIIIEEPAPDGPFGAKGVGEPPILATAPAIANAVANALGVRIRQLPLTPERVLAAMANSAEQVDGSTSPSRHQS